MQKYHDEPKQYKGYLKSALVSLGVGARLGHYSVTAKIGDGGMEDVYRARDTKLDRDGALKVLPQAFTDDSERLARFECEAKVLASLNHPDIGHIYGLEEAEGQKALVDIATQVGQGLSKAHAAVIIRDIRPANALVTRSWNLSASRPTVPLRPRATSWSQTYTPCSIRLVNIPNSSLFPNRVARSIFLQLVAVLFAAAVSPGGLAWVQPAPEPQDRSAQRPGPARTAQVPASGTLQLGGEEVTEPPLPEGVVLPPAERYHVEPTRIEDGPDLDGVLNEEVWLTAAVIDDFVQQEPAEGDPATERTVVRLMYDAQSLYVGVEAYDSQPDELIATEMRRDSRRLLDEDNFQIILDTFHDFRSGYMFVTSPLGAKLEQQIAEEGEGGYGGNSPNINVNWDGVWHVSSRRTDEGWVSEIAIPLVTLRFPETERQVWGVNFMRNIRRKNEQVFWAPIPRAFGLMRVSLAGTLSGLSQVSRGMDLRLTPYVLVGGEQVRGERALDGSGFGDVGLDVKYGVTSGLNLDVTLNTDFAQVEVDEQQVNLTRFPLFFPEKRDFFLENAGMFSVKNEGGFGRLAELFFTRRIGLSDTGQPIPIIGGGRLTGKVNRHSIAVLNIQTQEASGQPDENFFVGRYSRDIFARSKVGGLVINKEAVGDSSYNRTFAVDTSLAVHRHFTVTGFLAKTQSPGVSAGEGAAHVNARWLSPRWHVYAEYSDLQDNFNAEVGFVPRVGIRRTMLHGEWDPRPGKWGIRSMDPMMYLEYITDQHNRLLSREVHHMMTFYFENGSHLMFIYNDVFEQLDRPFRIRSDVTIPPGTYRFGEPSVSYRSDPSRRLYGRVRYSPQTFFDGDRTDVSGTLGVRATSRIAAEAQFRRSDVKGPWGAFVADLASLRFDWALSPEMTLRTLTQYHSSTDSVSTSVRFNWIYFPGSDLYIAYDELRMDLPGVPWLQNRQLAVKMTYLLSR